MSIMPRERINPPEVLHHPAFTRVVTVTSPMKMIFIAGQTPQGDDFACVAPGDMRAQYLFVIEKLSILLAAAGATWDDVTHRRTFVTDVAAYHAVRWDPTTPKFPGELSCSTMIGVTELSHPDFMIEIDLIAAVPG
jgi:enamine deaminase RidA (YjgF/YER057c/UK114 family)